MNLRVRCRAHNRLHAEQTFGKEHVERKVQEHRHPRKRGYPSDSYALAARGLMNLGFPRAEVRRALDAVGERRTLEGPDPVPLQTILRDALAVLV